MTKAWTDVELFGGLVKYLEPQVCRCGDVVCGGPMLEAAIARLRELPSAPPARAARGEPIDFELIRQLGRVARDAFGRFRGELLSGRAAPPPEAEDEYVGLAVLNALRAAQAPEGER